MGDEKMLMKRKVAVFDFDGTLTTKDTLLEFIKFACGTCQFYLGFLLYSPLLSLMKLHLYPNWKVKQKVFCHFFKGMRYERFKVLGYMFAGRIELFRREEMVSRLQTHSSNGDTIYIISASIEEWVTPWCEKLGVDKVLGTKVDVVDNVLTGKFLTKNCYGQEKVNRLLAVEPDRDGYYLYAYGDSRGDYEMIEYADEGIYV